MPPLTPEQLEWLWRCGAFVMGALLIGIYLHQRQQVIQSVLQEKLSQHQLRLDDASHEISSLKQTLEEARNVERDLLFQ